MGSEQKRLVDKSIEAFILGLEIYNKPTIRYRVEGFSFFVALLLNVIRVLIIFVSFLYIVPNAILTNSTMICTNLYNYKHI